MGKVVPTKLSYRVNGPAHIVGYANEPSTATFNISLYELDANGNGIETWTTTVVCREEHEHGKVCLAPLVDAAKTDLDASRTERNNTLAREATKTESWLHLDGKDVVLEEKPA